LIGNEAEYFSIIFFKNTGCTWLQEEAIMKHRNKLSQSKKESKKTCAQPNELAATAAAGHTQTYKQQQERPLFPRSSEEPNYG